MKPNQLSCAITLCFSLGTALTLQAQGPEQGQARQAPPRLALQALDLDHDGTLSAAEIKAAPQSLLKLDRNGDGMLTNDEVSPRPANAGATADELTTQLMAFDKTGKGYLVAADLPDRMQRLFLRADTNHDGKLTPDEIAAASARQGMPAGTVVKPGQAGGMFRLDAILNALDTNHDGIISADEIAAASTSLLTLDKNGDGQITPDEMPVRHQTPDEAAAHMLEESDTNMDGKLSRDEVSPRMLPQFDQIDTNHDGFLDKAELTEYFKTQANQPRK